MATNFKMRHKAIERHCKSQCNTKQKGVGGVNVFAGIHTILFLISGCC